MGPAATWTYLINDNPLPGFKISLIAAGNIGVAAAAAALTALPLLAAAPFVGLYSLIKRIGKLKGKGPSRHSRRARTRTPGTPADTPAYTRGALTFRDQRSGTPDSQGTSVWQSPQPKPSKP